MSRDLTEIKPGVGLGIIKFGMDRNQVKMILGEPEEKDVFFMTEDEDSESEAWYYDSKGLSLSFDAADNWRLVTIEIDSDAYTLHGHTLYGKSETELIAILDELKVDDWTEEEMPMDDAPTHKLISSDSLGINFWLDEEVVSEVQWGPYFNADDSVHWPD